MKLYVMFNGLADDFPKEAMAGTGAPFDPHDVISIPTATYLIDHPVGKILYDTGWTSRQVLTFPISENEYIVNTLARLGVRPEDIKYLILSHLHLDHAGNLEPFKDAEMFVSEAEFTSVAKLLLTNKLASPFVKADVEAWSKQDFKWRFIGGQYEVVDFVPGVKFVTLGAGHSFGILALLVELPKSGNILIASDAIYGRVNIGPPVRPPGVIMDGDGYRKSLDFLLSVAGKYEATLWYGHDLEQFETLTKADDGYYE
jgi:glyoxylase-like metal-dependent hydrolase (beta-lactamase superfamily II)